ncbi:MAG: hypothetical protein P8188_14880 [Gemmatimonadota bacterium]|jgi:hypothetical protein
MSRMRITIERVRLSAESLPPGGRRPWVRRITEAIERAARSEVRGPARSASGRVVVPHVRPMAPTDGRGSSIEAQGRAVVDAVREVLP